MKEEIGQAVGVDQSVVARELCKFPELEKNIISMLSEGHSTEEVCKRTE